MLLALVTLSAAEAIADAAPCEQTQVWATLPAPLATDVPVDTVPVGLLTANTCGGSAWTATLSIPLTDEDVVVVDHDSTVDGLVIEVDPGADLMPDTTYSLRFESADGGGVSSEIGFTTGSGTTTGLSGVPTVASALVFWQESGFTRIQAEVNVAAAAEGDSVVAIALQGQDAALDATVSDGPATVQLFGSTSLGEPPEEVCLVARQRDNAGNWTESDPLCVAPQIEAPDGGCGGCGGGAEPTPTVAAFSLVAGLALRRRRR